MSRLNDIINIKSEFKNNSDELIKKIEDNYGRALFLYSDDVYLPISESLYNELAYRDIKMKEDGNYLGLTLNGKLLNVGMKESLLGMFTSLNELFEACKNGHSEDLVRVDLFNSKKVIDLKNEMLKVLNNILYFINDNFIMIEESNTEEELDSFYFILYQNNEMVKNALLEV